MIKTKNGGFILACLAYVLWGLAPLYFKQVSDVPYIEMTSHRILWSFFFMLCIVIFSKKWSLFITLLKQPKMIFAFLVSSLLLLSTWLVFVWAVNHGYLLDVSLGNFIMPLFNVSLAMLFFKERLRTKQWIAISIATVAILIQLFYYGAVPWVALVMCFAFGFYGLLRKQLNIDAQIGLLIETLFLLPFAIYMLFYLPSMTGNLFHHHLSFNVLLMLAGVVTALPLICFNLAARLIKFSTLGFIQYINPSLSFILAVVCYHESLTTDKIVAFALIWLSLIIFIIDALSHTPKQEQ